MNWLLRALNAGVFFSMDEGGFGAGSPPVSESAGAAAGTETGSVDRSEAQDVNGAGQRQSEHVPYSRFQEVNEPYSQLREEARAYGYDDPREYTRALREAYENTQAGYQSQEQEAGDDPIQEAIRKHVEPLQQFVFDMESERRFQALKEQYPRADLAEVKRAFLAGEESDFQKAVEKSHKGREALRQQILAEYHEEQGRKATATAEGAGGGIASGGVDYSNMSSEEFAKYRAKVLQQR